MNAALLVRGSSVDPEPVEAALRAGGAGLKIHEDVGAGAPQIATALDLCDAHDVQLAIHTDGLNEALGVQDTLAAFAGRTVHAFHIEGAGGGHAPNLLDLAGEPNVLASSTSPRCRSAPAPRPSTSRWSPPSTCSTTARGARASELRVRPATMAAETVLHDLGVIPMFSSDSQGMGRIGEVVRRVIQGAHVMKLARGPEPGRGDNDRVLRWLAKVGINVAITHGLAEHVGSLQPGRLADAVLWQPHLFGVRPELVVKSGIAAWGASGDGNATTMLAEPTRLAPMIGALGATRHACRWPSSPGRRWTPSSRPRARGPRSAGAAS